MPMIKRILCPTDFSAHSAAALTYAIRLAEGLEADVTLLHVCSVALHVMPVGEYTSMDDTTVLMKAAQHELEVWVEKYSKQTSRELEWLLDHGDAYKRINAVTESLHADLIVMGTHGRSGLSRLVMGSVVERVVRTSSRPVLTIPRAAAEMIASADPSDRA